MAKHLEPVWSIMMIMPLREALMSHLHPSQPAMLLSPMLFDEPYVYVTRRGRKLHGSPTCATLYNSRNIETLPLSVAQRRYPRRGFCRICHG